MAEWLEQAFQWHGMYRHDLAVMSSNPDRFELGVHSTSVLSHTWTREKRYSILAHTIAYKSVEIDECKL